MQFNKYKIFTNLSEDSYKYLSLTIRKKQFKHGEIISESLNINENIIYVISGQIKAFKPPSRGDPVLLEILGEHTLFGEISAFSTNKYNNIEMFCVIDTNIIIIPNEVINNLIKLDHVLAINITKLLLEKISHIENTILSREIH